MLLLTYFCHTIVFFVCDALITTVECDTRKYYEFFTGIVYDCEGQVNNTGGNERVMFPRYHIQAVVMIPVK